MKEHPIIRPIDEVKATPVEGAVKTSIQVALGPEDQLPNFFLRRFTLEPGARIPAHSHPSIEHEQYLLEGEMLMSLDGAEHIVRPGDVVYIPAGVVHWYENRGSQPVRFLCMVPKTEHYETVWAKG